MTDDIADLIGVPDAKDWRPIPAENTPHAVEWLDSWLGAELSDLKEGRELRPMFAICRGQADEGGYIELRTDRTVVRYLTAAGYQPFYGTGGGMSYRPLRFENVVAILRRDKARGE